MKRVVKRLPTLINKSMDTNILEYSKKKNFDLIDLIEDTIFSVIIPSFLGDVSVEDHKNFKSLFLNLENLILDPLCIATPNLPFGNPGKCKKIRAEITKRLMPYIIENKKMLGENYISVWVEKPHVSGKHKGEYLTDIEITQEILGVMFASHINLFITLLWNLIYIFKNPNILKKLKNEIIELKNNDSDPTDSTYLSHCIKETMRLTSTLNLFIRSLEEDTILDGYHFKKGDIVGSPTIFVHFDENTLKEPKKFVPERWEEDNKFYGFGLGVHRCKGDNFALKIIKSVTCEIILNWNLTFENNVNPTINWENQRKPHPNVICSLSKN